MKTLVYHAGALGDFITIFPALNAWKKQYAPAKITLLGRPQYGKLAADSGLIDEICDVESTRFAPLFSSETNLPASLERTLRDFDAALIFADPGSPIIFHVKNAGIGEIRHQPPFPNHPIHIIDYHVELMGGGSLPKDERLPACIPDPSLAGDARRLISSWGRPFAVIHPGSGSRRKNWPLERFMQLSSALKERTCDSIVWLLGPAEEGIVPVTTQHVLRDKPLPLLVHILAESTLFIGNDSGIAHLAAAAGAPSVVLFGASNPAIWKPRGRHVAIVRSHTPCPPCHPGPASAKACGAECMKSISIDDVLAACHKAMA